MLTIICCGMKNVQINFILMFCKCNILTTKVSSNNSVGVHDHNPIGK